MLRRIFVGDNERVLLVRRKRFVNILAPGEYRIFTLGRNIELVRSNIQDLVFTSEWTDYLVKQRPELTARYFTVVETADSEVAVVYLDGKLSRVIGPANRVLFWRGSVDVTFHLIDVRSEPEAPARLLSSLARLGRESLVTFAMVDEGKRGLVYLDGRLARELGPGVYGFWNVIAAPRMEVHEMRRQTIEVSGQEILTKDKVTVRVNVSAVFEM